MELLPRRYQWSIDYNPERELPFRIFRLVNINPRDKGKTLPINMQLDVSSHYGFDSLKEAVEAILQIEKQESNG